VHLLDFDDDLYGEEVRVDFVRRLREVRAFDGVAALVAQMEADVAEARRVLGGSSVRLDPPS
jgi:riboflavin kinase/FMN adenylyltransferase